MVIWIITIIKMVKWIITINKQKKNHKKKKLHPSSIRLEVRAFRLMCQSTSFYGTCCRGVGFQSLPVLCPNRAVAAGAQKNGRWKRRPLGLRPGRYLEEEQPWLRAQ